MMTNSSVNDSPHYSFTTVSEASSQA